jgi:hypothetical protein
MLFLLMLLNDRDIMGSYINRPWQNYSAFAIVGFLILANGLYGYPLLDHPPLRTVRETFASHGSSLY